ncbi:MAG TPA: protease inhibitor I42 family protein [Labilithrix sp.]|nr:protease inhibitor I42 family protein [Labilithrix sp.]
MLSGLLTIAAACTRESVRPAVAEAGVVPEASASASAVASASASSTSTIGDAEAGDAAPAASDAATRDASVPTTTSTTTTSPSGDGGVKTVNLDESGDGKTVEVGKGGTIVLMLAASPTSGFDWAVTKAPAALGAPTMGFVAGGDQLGASGKRRIAWTLKDALPAGEHAVELGYARSFEKGVAPFKTFRFKVRAAK